MSALPRRPYPRELAILNHPDQATPWVGALVATLGTPDPELGARCAARLGPLAEAVPLTRARWRQGMWREGDPAVPDVSGRLGPTDARLLDPLDITREPPFRVVVDPAGGWLSCASHHAAFDARSLTILLRSLLEIPAEDVPRPVSPPPSRGLRPAPVIRRLLHPADPLAPSAPGISGPSLATRVLPPHGLFTGRVAQACVEAVRRHNVRRGRPLRRIGLSVAREGPPGVGNLAEYVRLDLGPGDRVAREVHRALARDPVPPELVFAPRVMRLLRPLVNRLSDSLLVSDLGHLDLPGVAHLALLPQSRGRSGVSFAAAEVAGGQATLTVAARDLSPVDLELLLDDAAALITARAPAPDLHLDEGMTPR